MCRFVLSGGCLRFILAWFGFVWGCASFVWVCWGGCCCDRLFCLGGGWFVLIGSFFWCVLGCRLKCSCRSGSCCLMVGCGLVL